MRAVATHIPLYQSLLNVPLRPLELTSSEQPFLNGGFMLNFLNLVSKLDLWVEPIKWPVAMNWGADWLCVMSMFKPLAAGRKRLVWNDNARIEQKWYSAKSHASRCGKHWVCGLHVNSVFSNPMPWHGIRITAPLPCPVTLFQLHLAPLKWHFGYCVKPGLLTYVRMHL